jgi:hypothetical protein
MSTFLAVFFFLYSILHLYLLLKARAAFSLGASGTALLALFMVFMMLLPVVTRFLENGGLMPAARFTATAGYTWMALLFLFFSASIVIDAARLAVYLFTAAAAKRAQLSMPSPRVCFLGTCAVAAAIAVYGWFEARHIRTEHVTLSTPRLAARPGRLRIVQISDIHLGLTVGTDRLRRIADAVREARPDLLVSTGDLLDGRMADEEGSVRLLAGLAPRLGKFAVTGNHEFYVGIGRAIEFTTRAGFRVLRGEAVGVDGGLNIVGVDDPAGPGYASSGADEAALLASVPNGRFTLLLKHRPVMDRRSADFIDLQLSGHVHDGQIFPFRLIVRFFFPLIEGLYSFPPHPARLYVSRGSGTWGPPIRFLAPPEVTIIDVIGLSGR